MKILIVDDTTVDRDKLKYLLLDKGHTVLTAGDGLHGIETANQENPDLILLDVVMPGKSGFEVCREIKHHDKTKDIPIIMVSSKNQKVDHVMSELQGASGHIGKPFQDQEVLDAVAKFG